MADENKTCGTLYVVATPIGNLGDITLRALETLKSADCIAAEDTRHTLKLLNHYGIKKPLISCHEHNERARCGEIAALLKSGKSVALVSDAGMPLISDPGGHVVSECIREGLPVTVCPGASAAIAAIALSGINTERFVFEGFLPKKARERKARLEVLRAEKRAVVLYESPHRLIKTLSELLEYLGERKLSVARELTKIHEEVLRTDISGALRVFSEREAVKGEFVLVIKGAEIPETAGNPLDGLTVPERVGYYMNEGLTETEALKKTARDLGVSKSVIYKEFKCKI